MMKPVTIRSIYELQKHLLYGGSYTDIMKALQLSAEDVAMHCHWSQLEPQRIVLAQMDCFELHLMCWEFGQRTPIHTFSPVESWLYMVEGSLSQDLYALPDVDQPYDRTQLNNNSIVYCNAYTGLQQLVNTNNDRSISS